MIDVGKDTLDHSIHTHKTSDGYERMYQNKHTHKKFKREKEKKRYLKNKNKKKQKRSILDESIVDSVEQCVIKVSRAHLRLTRQRQRENRCGCMHVITDDMHVVRGECVIVQRR